jgi:hypothetical protein
MNGGHTLAGSHIGVGIAAFGVASLMGVLQGVSIADVDFPLRSESLAGPALSQGTGDCSRGSQKSVRRFSPFVVFVARTAYLPRDANTRIAKTTMNTAMTSRISLVIVI